ncbi:MAG: hypothetical protein IJX16_05020 [Clostridia bacterium]|nr:hypothetical protein [Clostridia bacterium]
MVEFFKTEEYFKAKSQRKKVLAGYLAILALYVCGSVAVLLWYLTLPYMSETITTVKIVQYSITAVFVIFSFIYLGIPFKRVNKYFKVMRNMATGLKETSIGSFFEYDENVQTRDGVEFKALVFLEWNKFKNDFYERRVLIYVEKEFPEFEKHANVRYVTQGNKLCSYEILE